MHGPVLGVPGLKTWAVIGDVLNEKKPASRVVARLEASGRSVLRVSPYDTTGACYKSLESVPRWLQVDAVNLIISERFGMIALEEMKARGCQYVFAQPGADTAGILQKAEELGLTVQRGCVLVSDLPPMGEGIGEDEPAPDPWDD